RRVIHSDTSRTRLAESERTELIYQCLVVRKVESLIAEQPEQRRRQTADARRTEGERLHRDSCRLQPLRQMSRLKRVIHQRRPIGPTCLANPALDLSKV